MSFLWNRKQWLGFVGAVIVIGIGVWFGYYKWYLPQYGGPQSHQFQGQLIKIADDGSLNMKGTRIIDTDPNSSDYTHTVTVTVKVTGDTKFMKTLLYLPTIDEVKATGGKYYPKDLKQEQQVGSASDLGSNIGNWIIIKTANNSVGDSTLNALEIDYTVSVYPK